MSEISILRTLTSRSTFASAVSGSLASMLAMALLYPLDRVRTIAQVKETKTSSILILKEIIKDEGINGLYLGLKHMVIVLGCSNFVYFYFNSLFKALYVVIYNKIMAKRGKVVITTQELGNVTNLALASLAGIINVLLTTPLWVVATRLSIQTKSNKNDKAQSSANNTSAKESLMAKLKNASFRLAANKYSQVSPTTNIMLDKMKNESKSEESDISDEENDADTESICSATSSSCTSVTSVSDVKVKTAKGNNHLQEKNPPVTQSESEKLPDNIVLSMIHVAKTQGIGELWSGTLASLVLVSNPVIQFFAYEKLKNLSVKLRGRSLDTLSSVDFFVLGAFAKMVATIFTYPLQLSQTRLRRNRSCQEDGKQSKINEGMFQMLSSILKKEGVSGWFKGMDAKLLQTCLTAAFMFAFYEKLFKIFYKIIN